MSALLCRFSELVTRSVTLLFTNVELLNLAAHLAVWWWLVGLLLLTAAVPSPASVGLLAATAGVKVLAERRAPPGDP